MGTAEGSTTSWRAATLDFLLAVLGFAIVWYPMMSLGNAVLGSPVTASTVNLLVGVLAFGGSYPVVAGGWSLGQLGEYVFVLAASAFAWGLVCMLILVLSGVSFSGSNPAPQAAVWSAAYLTAYFVVYRAQLRIFG